MGEGERVGRGLPAWVRGCVGVFPPPGFSLTAPAPPPDRSLPRPPRAGARLAELEAQLRLARDQGHALEGRLADVDRESADLKVRLGSEKAPPWPPSDPLSATSRCAFSNDENKTFLAPPVQV